MFIFVIAWVYTVEALFSLHGAAVLASIVVLGALLYAAMTVVDKCQKKRKSVPKEERPNEGLELSSIEVPVIDNPQPSTSKSSSNYSLLKNEPIEVVVSS